MSKYEIPFLTACLQSMDETIDDLLVICQKNGGTLA